jgi:uncharacterized membrane protein YphA (DoxX/SURF4 family)
MPDEAPLESHAGSRSDPRYQAYLTLRVGYTVLPIVMGLDKFFNLLVTWPKYLADWIDNIVPGTAQQMMYGVGVVEIVAGLIVAIKPRYGAYIVALWLAGIIVNLVSYGEWYDVAVRDFGLFLGALTLARLASVYDRPLGKRG